jgi:hypothetical protein
MYGGKGVRCWSSMIKEKWWDRKFKMKDTECRRQDLNANQGPDVDSVWVGVQGLVGGIKGLKKEKPESEDKENW